jgi:hypothetical protein
MSKKTELKIVQNKIVIYYFTNILLKATGEKFDPNEIEEYLKMTVDDYNSNNLSLSIDEGIKWLEYRIISFAYSAIGLNKRQLGAKSSFLKKADIYRKKCDKISSISRVNEMVKLDKAQKQAKLEGNSKKRVEILKTMSNRVKGYTRLAKAGKL